MQRRTLATFAFAVLATALSAAPAHAEGPGLLSKVRLVADLSSPVGGELASKLPGSLSVQAAGDGRLLPCILSFIIPGLGQVLNGQLVKGVVLFAVVVAGSFAAQAIGGVLGVALWVVTVAIWVAGWVDAYNGGGIIPIGGGGDASPPPEDLRVPVLRPVAGAGPSAFL